jgi:hypothetical protein
VSRKNGRGCNCGNRVGNIPDINDCH